MTTNADRKLLALGVKSAAFTARELTKILDYLLGAIKNGLTPTEQKSYADFQSPGGVSLLNVSPQQKDVQGFAELARQNGVNVSVKQNQESQIFYFCLQGQLADIEKSTKEYQKRLTQQTQNGVLHLFRSLSDFLLNMLGGVEMPGSSQDTLPYLRMFRDGLCEVEPGLYSRSIQFYDINYRLSKDESISRIFNQYCALLNSIDTSVSFQLFFNNLFIDLDELKRDVELPLQHDKYDVEREGYSEYLKEQLEAGRNEIQRTKYIAFSVHADSVKEARVKLRQVKDDLIYQLSTVMKVRAYPLRGKDRLRVMQEAMRDDPKDRLYFDFREQAFAGLTSKDAIAPSAFDFRYPDVFGVGDRWACASWFQIDANRLHDTALSDFLDMDGALMVSIHLQPVNQEKAIRTVKSKISDIDSIKASQNKKAVEQGIDMDIMPTDINTYGAEALELLDGLQTKDERYFLITVIIVNIAETKSRLESAVAQAKSIAQQHNCSLRRFRFQQEQAFQSALPLGKNHVPVKRGMTTTGVGILVPFITEDIYMGKGSLHYGRNPLSQRLILINRKELTNLNSLILGIPGSGKSVAAKMEMSEVMLATPDDIIVVDPESEYWPLVKKLGGQVIELSATSDLHINPMDMSMYYNSEDADNVKDPVIFKSTFILSLFDIILDGKMTAIQRSIIDGCVQKVYEPYIKDCQTGSVPCPENMPVLEDMYNALLEHENDAAGEVAAALEIYVHGSLRVFNNRTNIKASNRFLCFDIKNLGSSGKLKELGHLILQDHVWNRVTENRSAKRFTWYFCDEFHLLLQTPQTAEFCVSTWKRLRKFFALPTGITQNVTDFLNNPNAAAVESILSNTPFIRMLEQTHSDAQILSRFLDISDDQMGYVDSPPVGHGLLKCGGTILPFSNRLPKENVLYPYITTKPGEV